MGLAGNDQTIYLATLYQLWRLENVLQPGETTEGYDRSYVPQVGYTTGDLNVHDVALDGNNQSTVCQRPLQLSGHQLGPLQFSSAVDA